MSVDRSRDGTVFVENKKKHFLSKNGINSKSTKSKIQTFSSGVFFDHIMDTLVNKC